MPQYAHTGSDNSELNVRRGTLLPHWTMHDAIYAVTFRLADALPSSVLRDWRSERRDIVNLPARLNRPNSSFEKRRLKFLSSTKVEAALDAGIGACWMRDEGAADLVAETLLHFDGKRYRLFAWCVMPNHAHVVFQPIDGHDLSDIVHSWKSFTTNRLNKMLGRSGEFWHREYYDHLIRDEQGLTRAVEYVLGNPAKADLEDWKWVGLGEAGAQGTQPQLGG